MKELQRKRGRLVRQRKGQFLIGKKKTTNHMKSHKGGENLKKERQRKTKSGRAKWRQSRSLGIKEEKKELLEWKKPVKDISKTISNVFCNSSCNARDYCMLAGHNLTKI